MWNAILVGLGYLLSANWQIVMVYYNKYKVFMLLGAVLAVVLPRVVKKDDGEQTESLKVALSPSAAGEVVSIHVQGESDFTITKDDSAVYHVSGMDRVHRPGMDAVDPDAVLSPGEPGHSVGGEVELCLQNVPNADAVLLRRHGVGENFHQPCAR